MEASLFSLMYLAFRFMPFILICYYVISYVFLQQVDALLFLIGLLITCVLAFMVGGINFFREAALKSNNTICSTIGLAKDEMLSVLPMSTVVYAYALSYLGIPILHYNRNQSNLPILILFPILLFLDILWLYFFGCSSPTNIFAAGVVGMTGGLAYSEIIFQSAYKNAQYDSILTDTEECNISSASGFHCVQRTQQGADKLGQAKDMEANLLMNTYKYLGGLVSSGEDKLQKVLKQGSAYGTGAASFMEQTAGSVSALSGSPPTYGYTSYPYTLMTGNQYNAAFQVASADVCQSTCSSDASCVAFVYDSRKQTCTFHKGIGTNFVVNGTTSSTSTTYYKQPVGFLTIPSTSLPSNFIPLNQSAAPTPTKGPTQAPVNGQKVGTPLACASLCMATSGCYGYTFGTQTGMCSLYGKAIHLNTYVSSTTTDMALFHLTEVSGTNYKDIDLDTIEPAANTGACIQACVSNPACVGFSYNTFDMSNQVCDLKSQMTTPEDNANFTSYFMPKSIYNTHTNSAYGSVGSTTTTAPGNSTNTWTSSDPISMAAQCDADPSCLGFMYNGSQFCRIDSTNLLATPTTATGTTTYFKQGTDPLAIQQFLPIPQTALQGGNVDKNAVHTGSTVPACASLCQANKQCIGFVFDTSTSTCTLKKIYSGHGTNVLKGDTTATTYISQPSGYTATLNSMVPSVSSDKTLLNTTPNGCADACTANKGCRGFVYIHATNQCYLKKEISTTKQDNNFILYTRE